MADETLNLRLRAQGSEDVKRALNGITKDAKAAENELRKENQKTTKDFQDQIRKRTGSLRNEAREGAEIVRRAEIEKRKEFAKTGRELHKSIATATRLAVKEARAFVNANGGVILGGLGLGVGLAGRRAQNIAGSASVDSTKDVFVNFQQRLIGIANQAKLTEAQQKSLQDQIIKVSNNSLISASQLLAGVDKAQEKFSDISLVTDNFSVLAEGSSALSAHFEDMVNVAGQFVQNMGLAKKEIPALVGALEQSQEAGALSVADIGENFAQSIGLFASVTGQRGGGGARAFLATGQVLAKGGANPEQLRTQQDAILNELVQDDVRKKLGIANGAGIDLADLFGKLASNEKIDAVALNKIFGSEVAAKGANTLIEQTRAARARGEADPLSSIANVSSDAGLRVINKTQSEKRASPSGALLREKFESQNRLIENFDNLARSSAQIAGQFSALQGTFPLVTEGLGVLAQVLTGLAAFKFLAGTGAVAGARGLLGRGVAALGTGATAIAGSAAAVPLAIAAGGAALGTGAYFASDYLTGGTNSDPRKRGLQPMTDPKLIREQTEATKALVAEFRRMRQGGTSVDVGKTPTY